MQSAGDRERLVLDSPRSKHHLADQRKYLRERWLADGLPGTITFLHVFNGEMELTLDHEAIRWGRSLKPGDEVHLAATGL